ncbi:calcium binding protein [Anaeramoeba ignava]|uniref:Calcium binding protein n=1 Tax=Anaeramoeba ignava TaxID=1746090 RepID=A0A9Q0LLF2_ANAIG|nr:calcium binding protein [Anaeramoeba ignava]
MGNSKKKGLSKQELDHLRKSTHFNHQELLLLYSQFLKENPSGIIQKSQFKTISKQLGIEDPFVGELLFKNFDENGDGEISFSELITAMSITSRGSTDEKLEFLFNIYDLDGNGFIERDEIHQIFKSLHNISIQDNELNDEKALISYVDQAFDEADQDKDGALSLDEFKSKAKSDPKFLKSLNPFTSETEFK